MIHPNNIEMQVGTDARRTMPDTQTTANYLDKLSHANIVTVWYASGEICMIDCGVKTWLPWLPNAR